MINLSPATQANIDGGFRQVADKDRVRLTVYVDSAIEERFRRDAEAMYRNLSDHMNAILAEYYSAKEKEAAKADKSDGG